VASCPGGSFAWTMGKNVRCRLPPGGKGAGVASDLEAEMTDLVTQAAWVLVAAFALSLAYELYRATMKAGTSPHDSAASFVKNNVPLYVVATLVIILLFADVGWAPWVGLIFSAVVVAASVLFYNPSILLERDPGVVDWFEDLVFTSLVFLAMALLIYQVLDVTLQP
jgi:phosphatidylserine synthase